MKEKIIKPVLATDLDLTKATFPYLGFAKIDGVRGLYIDKERGFTSRSMKKFANVLVTARYELPEFYGFDGELTFGSITDNRLVNTTTSVVNTFLDERASVLHWNLFDLATEETINLPYKKRYELLLIRVRELLTTHPEFKDRISVIPARLILVEDELEAFDFECLSLGYEGTVYRSLETPYKFGRTTVKENSYLRLKRFVQEDAIVLSIVEAMENNNEKTTNELGGSTRSTHKENKKPKGMVGSLICEDIKTSKIITVGPGEMDHDSRVYYFQNQNEIVNKIISYKNFPKGVKDKPRFPTFVNIRDKTDLVTE